MIRTGEDDRASIRDRRAVRGNGARVSDHATEPAGGVAPDVAIHRRFAADQNKAAA